MAFSVLKDAIARRDADAILSIFFQGDPPRLRDGYRFESENWDFKGGCPGHGVGNQGPWAHIAADVLAFYNTGGGVLFFGIDDKSFSYCGTKSEIDSKLFNDKIRKYCGDKFFVSYCRAFPARSGLYLGMAIVPKRGLQVVPFFADAPESDYFHAGDIAVRKGDETLILRGERAAEHLKDLHLPNSDAQYLVNEPGYRIIRPDWDDFIQRQSLCDSLLEGLSDERTFVTSLTGVGGVGKTSLACWGVLRAYEDKVFDYIVSTSAKDRELTSSGIREIAATASTLDELLNAIVETIGFSELKIAPIPEKLKQVRELIKGTNILLFVDNLETVQDANLIDFLDNLPVPVKAVLTSRKARVRKAVFPLEVGPFERREALTFLDSISAKKGRYFINGMTIAEHQLIVDACFRVPLVIEWFVGIAKNEAAAVELAREIELKPPAAEEVLEFSFRRVHTELNRDAQQVLKALSMFSDPQPIEALSAGCRMRIDVVNSALDDLLDTSLVIKSFDRGLNDTTYGMLPITRRFAYAELRKEPGLEQSLRRTLSTWYEGADIHDESLRRVAVAVRQGKRDTDTLLVDAAKEMRAEGKMNQAEDTLLQAVQCNPQSWRAMRELGDFYKHEKRIGQALQFYARAANLAPKKGKDRALIFREYGHSTT